VSLGCLFLAVVCAAWALTRPAPRVPDAEEIALERAHGIPAQATKKEPAVAADSVPAPAAAT
jgi:AGZA family xanthine/uracil permease-like MFS transporter